MNKDDFKIEIKKIFPKVSEKFFYDIEIYRYFLNKFNAKYNLTRLNRECNIYSDYFYESVIPYKNFNFNNIKNLLDIGTGSGIPGLLLKLLFPHLQLTLIDSSNKKIVFLNKLKDELNLKNITCLCKRAENVENCEIEKFDFVTSRAVARLKILLEISAKYAKINGLIVEPKSRKFKFEEDELSSTNLLNKLSLAKKEHFQFISINNKFHYVFVYKKIKKTNKFYPREWKKIIQ